MPTGKKIPQGGFGGRESQLTPRDRGGGDPFDAVVLVAGLDLAADHTRPVHDYDDWRARVGGDAAHAAQVRLKACLFPGLAHGRVLDGLAPVHEAAWEDPLPARRLDRPARKQDTPL